MMDCMLLENNDFAVSVIIPSFNRPDFLQEALLSALNQTIPPVEILVIDDGSDPEALSIIQSLAAIHDCIRIIALGQHLGVSHARNVGLDLAVGEWILFLDDDDILFTTFFLENCYRALSKNPDSGVIAGRALRFQSSSAVVFPRDLISGYDLLTYEKDPLHALIVNGLAVGSFMIRRESIGTMRFSEQIRYNEDILFLISVLRSGASLVVADRAIVAIRRHKFQSQSILKTHYSDDAFFDFIYPALRKIHEALLGADPFLTYFTRLTAVRTSYGGRWVYRIPQYIAQQPVWFARYVYIHVRRRLLRACFWLRPGSSAAAPSGSTGIKRPRPSLLFICGVVPSARGPGVAMRAYQQLISLAQTHSVHLLLSLPRPEMARVAAPLFGICEDVEIIHRNTCSGWIYKFWWRWKQFRGDTLALELSCEDLAQNTRAWNPANSFDRIHVFRLYMAPLAHAFLKQFPTARSSLDMDDLESRSRRSMAAVHRLRGDDRQATLGMRQAQQYGHIEAQFLPEFDQVYLASEKDRALLAQRSPDTRISVLPNVVQLPARKDMGDCKPARRLSLLFVGTLHYFPNQDAMAFFTSEIAPVLDASGLDWHLRVVGPRPRRLWPQRADRDRRWEWAGWIEDLGPEYAAADIVVVPIRCGGGTRIKLLEAFAHQVPVVATSLAIEGLPLTNGVHCLVADSPSDFAGACASLQTRPALRNLLVANSFELVRDGFTPEALRQVLR